MTDLPYTYTDPNGHVLRVSANSITVWEDGIIEGGYPDAGVWLPEGTDTAALARAVLAAAGDTEHKVLSAEEWRVITRVLEEEGARSMRERAVQAARESDEHPAYELSPRTAAVAKIRDLPLLPTNETPSEQPTSQWDRLKSEIPRIYGRDRVEDLPHDSEYATALHDVLTTMKRIENNSPLLANGETAPEPSTWPTDGDDLGCGNHCQCGGPAPKPDFRAHLVAELLNATVDDAAEELADDPTGTWERAYAAWTNHRRDAAARTNTRYEERLAALEGLTRAVVDLVEGHSVDLSQAKAAIRGLARRPLTADTDH